MLSVHVAVQQACVEFCHAFSALLRHCFILECHILSALSIRDTDIVIDFLMDIAHDLKSMTISEEWMDIADDKM